MSQLTEVAEAVRARIAAADLSLEFTPQRVDEPVRELQGIVDQLVVQVLPVARTSTPATRGGGSLRTVTVQVGVQQGFATKPTTDDTEPLKNLVDELLDLMEYTPELDGTDWVLVEVRNAPTWSALHLEENSTFLSVLELTYEG